MEAKAKLFGHPVHQMLVVFPLGLLATSFFFDVAYLIFHRSDLAMVSDWMIFSGVIGAVIAAVFGLIDWVSIPRRTRAKKVGFLHGVGNVIVVGLFGASWFLRQPTPSDPTILTILLSSMGVGLALITSWLGGELVDRFGVGVADGAHLDAPGSLSGRPASENRVTY
jgi:uncharacterized membrane protein